MPLIEFSNRTITVPVTIIAIAAWLLAFRRRPYRRDLMWIALLLPLGVVAQAVLGGLTVEGKLAYGWVMGHFALSILLILVAWMLVWRSMHEPEELAASAGKRDVTLVWCSRALVLLGALTIFAGTAATAAGPHAGGEPGQRISRLTFDGRGTMDFVIHRHSELAIAFGILALVVWALARERGASAEVRRASDLHVRTARRAGRCGGGPVRDAPADGARVGACRARVSGVDRRAVDELRGRITVGWHGEVARARASRSARRERDRRQRGGRRRGRARFSASTGFDLDKNALRCAYGGPESGRRGPKIEGAGLLSGRRLGRPFPSGPSGTLVGLKDEATRRRSPPVAEETAPWIQHPVSHRRQPPLTPRDRVRTPPLGRRGASPRPVCRWRATSRSRGCIRSTPSSGRLATRASAMAIASPSSNSASSSRRAGRRTRRTSSRRSTFAGSSALPSASIRCGR